MIYHVSLSKITAQLLSSESVKPEQPSRRLLEWFERGMCLEQANVSPLACVRALKSFKKKPTLIQTQTLTHTHTSAPTSLSTPEEKKKFYCQFHFNRLFLSFAVSCKKKIKKSQHIILVQLKCIYIYMLVHTCDLAEQSWAYTYYYWQSYQCNAGT